MFLIYINNIEDWLFENYNWQVWDRSVYAIGEIPNNIQWQGLAVIIMSAICACLVGALLPSVQGARRRPVEVLHVGQL